MTDPAPGPKPDRPPLPRDAFRTYRVNAAATDTPAAKPVVVTPAYEDQVVAPAVRSAPTERAAAPWKPRPAKARDRNPFDGYGERSSSRPYALRLPDPIDLVVRQMAAEERTHPLRIIDRIIYDHLKRNGRLPPTGEV